MSTTVDSKVVEMRFDNKQFEDGVKTSLSTIDKLKSALNFNDAVKGLNNLGKSTKKVDMSVMAKGVQSVHAEFKALEIMGITAITNLTNSVLNSGKRMASALTVDPIRSGFQEYETQINSVQTILANTSSKGTTLEQVNAALDELNTYADKTIYNFTEMTRNIGTFTAAGVDLDTSVQSIKGIANLAAVSGSTSQQASTAMYQLSQALASGTVKLQDWNSVVNAGMGGQVFQDALKRTASAMGTNVDELIEVHGSFRESLTQGAWLTTDVLNETLGQFAGAYTDAELASKGYSEQQIADIQAMAETATDAATKVKTFTQLFDTLKEAAQSGWTQTWEYIIGDFVEAKSMFTELSDLIGGIIGASADRRNSLVGGAFTGGWEQLSDKIETAGINMDDFQTKILEVGRAHDSTIGIWIDKGRTLTDIMQSGLITGEMISETLHYFIDGATGVSNATGDATAKLEEFQTVVNRVIKGEFGNGADRVKALTEAGYDYVTVQGLANQLLASGAMDISALSEAQLTNMGYTEEQVQAIKVLAEEAEKTGTPINDLINTMNKPSGRELMIDTFRISLHGLINTISAVRGAWIEVFPPMTSAELYNIIEGIHEFVSGLQEAGAEGKVIDRIARTMKGIFSLLHIFTSFTGGVLEVGLKVLCNLLGVTSTELLDITASIGDTIVAFDKWLFENNSIAKSIKNLISGLKTGGTQIKSWLKNLKTLPETNSGLTKLLTELSKYKMKIGDYFSGGLTKIKEFITYLKSFDSISLDNLEEILRNFSDNVIGYFLNAKLSINEILESFSEFKTGLNLNLTEVGNILNRFKDIIFSFFSYLKSKVNIEIGLDDLLTLGLVTSLMIAMNKIGNLFDILSKEYISFKSFVADIKGGLVGVLRSASVALTQLGTSFKAEAMYTSAKAILVLCGALVLLTQLDTAKMWSAVGAITVIGIVLMGLTAGLSKLNTGIKDSAQTALSITGLVLIAAAVIVLVKALKEMESLDKTKLTYDLILLATLSAGLVLFASLMSQLAPKFSLGALSAIIFAIGLKELISAFVEINGLDMKVTAESIVFLIGAVASLAILALAFKHLKLSSASFIITVVVSLKILVGAFDDMAKLDMDKAEKNLNVFIIVFSMFGVLMMTSQFAGQHAAKAGIGILAMSAALIITIAAIKMVAGISGSDLVKGLFVIGRIMNLFAVIVMVSKFAGQHAAKAGLGILAMSASLILLSAVIVILSRIKPDGLTRAVTAISILMLVFGAVVALSHFAGGNTKTITAIASAIGILAVALVALSFIDPATLRNTTACLSIIMGMLALIVYSAKDMNAAAKPLVVLTIIIATLGGVLLMLSNFTSPTELLASSTALSLLLLSLAGSLKILGTIDKDAQKALPAMGIMVAIVAGLAIILSVMSALNVTGSLQSAAAISLILLSMAVSLKIISGVGAFANAALPAMGIMTAIVAGLAVILGVLTALNVAPSIETAAALSILLLSMSAACLILSAVGGTGPAALIGAGVLAGVITELGVFIGAIGALVTKFPECEEFLDKGIPILEKIGSALGSFFGNIVEGFLTSATSGLTKVADNITNFIAHLMPAFIMVKMVDKDIVDSIKNIAEAVLILTGADIISSIGSVIAGSIDYSSFSDKMTGLGDGIVAFSTAISNGTVNIDEVKNAVEVGKMLAELSKELPNSGGLAGMILGNNDADTFGKKLQAFGEGIAAFSTSVDGTVKINEVKNAVEAGKIISDLANNLPESGGIIGDIFGNNDADTFGKKLGAFGKGISAFSKAVSGTDNAINTGAVETAVAAGIIISDLAEGLPKSGGWFATIFGDNDIEDFSNKLAAFGTGISNFSKNVSGDNAINASTVQPALSAASKIVTMAETISASGGLFKNATALMTYQTQLATFSTSLTSFYKKISEIDAASMAGVIESINKIIQAINSMSEMNDTGVSTFVNALGELGDSSVAEFVAAFNESNVKVSGGVKKMVQYAVIAVKTRYSEFKTEGVKSMTQYTEGMTSSTPGVIAALKTMIDGLIVQIKSKMIDFNLAAAYLVQGFTDGITINTYKASAAAAAMATAAKEAAEKALDEHSPSKEFYNIGNYAGIGFVNAMVANVSSSYNAGTRLATAAREGLSKAMSQISNIVDAGMDTQPTIRPVLDLESLKSSVGAIDGLVNPRRAIGISANLNAISSGASTNQNGNYEVVSAIKSLRKDLGNIGGTSYTINGVTYNDGSEVSIAVQSLIRAAKIERRV